MMTIIIITTMTVMGTGQGQGQNYRKTREKKHAIHKDLRKKKEKTPRKCI